MNDSSWIQIQKIELLPGGWLRLLTQGPAQIAVNGGVWNGLTWVPYWGPEINVGPRGRSGWSIRIAKDDMGAIRAGHQVRVSDLA